MNLYTTHQYAVLADHRVYYWLTRRLILDGMPPAPGPVTVGLPAYIDPQNTAVSIWF
jgi:hypothetical protein